MISVRVSVWAQVVCTHPLGHCDGRSWCAAGTLGAKKLEPNVLVLVVETPGNFCKFLMQSNVQYIVRTSRYFFPKRVASSAAE